MNTLRPSNLSKALKSYRAMREMNQRHLAREVGISVSTLCRIEQGIGAGDIDTFVAILNWLVQPAQDAKPPRRTNGHAQEPV